MQNDVKTFRGRTLEELLPQIRAELGADAIVLRRREGLAGGIGGFFQRSFVEVDARRPAPGETVPEARNDRATAEGLSTPGIQTLIQQAAPFADALARAGGASAGRDEDVLMANAHGEAHAAPSHTAPNPAAHAQAAVAPNAAAQPQAAAAPNASAPRVAAGLYGPQPIAPVEPDPFVPTHAPAVEPPPVMPPTHGSVPPPTHGSVPPPAHEPVATAAPEPAPPAAEVIAPPPAMPERPASADAAEQRLVAAGLTAGFAADVVGEAIAHGLPFGSSRPFEELVRSALTRRLAVLSNLGPDRRVIAVAGAGGAGKSALIGRLAAAYAAAGHEVVVIALRSRDGGNAVAAELEPLGVSVIAVTDGEQAARRLRRREPLVTLVDTPALGAGDAHRAAELAPELRALGCTEVHLALPATISAAAAEEVADALTPLGLTHIALTHADQTARPGAPVEIAVRFRRPLSYVAARDGVEPADAATLASQLLP